MLPKVLELYCMFQVITGAFVQMARLEWDVVLKKLLDLVQT